MDALLPSEWNRLVRLCASLSGNVDTADDLAQETLIEAWRNAEKLQNPDAQRQWLSGIARNVCRRWLRNQGRDSARWERLAQQHHHVSLNDRCQPDHAGQLDRMLERDDLAHLLDRALDFLPVTTRDVMIQRYVDERAHAEIADQLGLSEGAVAVRIDRGKQALREALARPELRAEARACGFGQPTLNGWQETRIWCPFCARNRLTACIDREASKVFYRCAGRCFHDGTIIGGSRMKPETSALKSVKSILRRELIDLHVHYRQALAERLGWCHECGHPVALERWMPDGSSSLSRHHTYGIQMGCRSCGAESGASLWHLLLDTPDVQQFWQRHPRMHALPMREIEVDGRAALLSGFASVDTNARIEMLSAANSYDILNVNSSAHR